MEHLLKLCKQACSVSNDSLAKDEEFKLLIKSAQEDLERQAITNDLSKSLVIQAIVMYVKGNFGNTDSKEKEIAMQRYSFLCNNMSLSSEYKEKEI